MKAVLNSKAVKNYKNPKAEAPDAAQTCKSGNLLLPYSLNPRAVKDYKNLKAEATDTAQICKRAIWFAALTEHNSSEVL